MRVYVHVWFLTHVQLLMSNFVHSLGPQVLNLERRASCTWAGDHTCTGSQAARFMRASMQPAKRLQKQKADQWQWIKSLFALHADEGYHLVLTQISRQPNVQSNLFTKRRSVLYSAGPYACAAAKQPGPFEFDLDLIC